MEPPGNVRESDQELKTDPGQPDTPSKPSFEAGVLIFVGLWRGGKTCSKHLICVDDLH